MNREKKLWFHKVTSRLWLPISWEGWLMYVGLIGGLALILKLNGLTPKQSVSFSRDWPVLVEMLVLVVGFYVLSRGRVRK